jgi:hypothetical protein
LNENLDRLNPAVHSYLGKVQQGFLQQRGDLAAAHRMALQSLEDLREQQASALAYFDAFLIFAVVAMILNLSGSPDEALRRRKRRSSCCGIAGNMNEPISLPATQLYCKASLSSACAFGFALYRANSPRR